MPRRAPVLVLTALLGTALAAPAQAAVVPGSAFAENLTRRLSQTTDVKVTRATCPRRVELREGREFDCRVSFASGDRTPVRLRLKDAEGGYRANITNLLLRHLEDQLEDVLSGRGTSATVRCPRARKVRKDDDFTCAAVADTGVEDVIEITQIGDGRVRYRMGAR